ncbi:MAG: lamin tail domain-containing protein [Anaerolineae bacterium]|nr:lamin tail domain-containing protein [Anaerolineae bacterium]
MEYNPPGSNLDEYVLIENRGAGSQDMTGWALYDEQWHAYFFPADFILLGGDSVRVWTKSDTDTATDLYWGLDDPVWGNSGDTAFLRDSRNVIDWMRWP